MTAIVGMRQEVVVAAALARAAGGGGGRTTVATAGWTPFSTFLEQLLEREFTPFFLQMMARVCLGGGGGGQWQH